MNPRLKLILFVILIIVYGYLNNSSAQQLPSGPQVLTFFSDVDDTEQPYGLYLPKNFDSSRKYPLVIMLHGAGSNHRLALKRVFGKSNLPGESDVEASRYFPDLKDVDYIVASPFARGTMGYQGVAEKDVMDVLADVKRRFPIDENRTYLTGLSMGGGGALWIGLTRPDIWAAIAPVCPAPPKGTQELIGNALNFPLYFFHGDQDPAVNVKVSRDFVQNLKGVGSKVEYNEYPGVQHNSWEDAYKEGFIFDWFSKYTRNPFPDQVRFTSPQYKYNQAYWVRLDEMSTGTLAKIDAKFTGVNQLTVTTENLSAFTLKLTGHPKLKKGEPFQMMINGKNVNTQANDSISLIENKGSWMIGSSKLIAFAKTKGAEGPIKEAFASRHIYVYGTAGNPTQQELKERAKLAEEAANWSAYRGSFLGRIMVFPRVLADNEVRPSDYQSSNLILFGTKETNTIIRKYAQQLPLHLDTTANDVGLFYIYPSNGHYVAISSGLPWWKGADMDRFSAVPSLSGIADFKDYIVFKNSINNVLIHGYFDKNWKLKAADSKKLFAGDMNIKQ